MNRPLPQAVPTYLFKRTLPRLLIRTPAQKLCAMTEAAAGEVIVLDFDDELRRERLPFG